MVQTQNKIIETQEPNIRIIPVKLEHSVKIQAKQQILIIPIHNKFKPEYKRQQGILNTKLK